MKNAWLFGLASLAAATGSTAALAQSKQITFAHQDMVGPFRVLIDQHAIEKDTGVKIDWRKFGGGGDVIRAMASGDVQMGEVGSAGVAAAASQGLDIQVVWILDDIAQAEQLVARNGSGVGSIKDLKGKKIATPFVSTSHYQLLAALNDAGVNPREVKILNMRPPEVASAWERGDIDATFIWDPVLAKVKENGKVLISSADIAKTGKPTFDAVVVERAWAQKNKAFVQKFIDMMDAENAKYKANKDKWVTGSPEVASVAKVSGADAKEVPQALSEYAFPSAKEQATKDWLGGGKDGLVARALLDTAKFLKEQGRITDVQSDYTKYVDDEFVKKAAEGAAQ